MTTPAVVWLVVGLVTATAVLALLIALIRHLFVLGRTVARFQEEVGPIAADIGSQSDGRRRARGGWRGTAMRGLGGRMSRPGRSGR